MPEEQIEKKRIRCNLEINNKKTKNIQYTFSFYFISENIDWKSVLKSNFDSKKTILKVKMGYEIK